MHSPDNRKMSQKVCLIYSSSHSFTKHDSSRFPQCLLFVAPRQTTYTVPDYFPKQGKGWKVGNRFQGASSPAGSDCVIPRLLQTLQNMCNSFFLNVYSKKANFSAWCHRALPKNRAEGRRWSRSWETAGRNLQSPFLPFIQWGCS